jgi:Xaa-Pro aminopeptidase
MITSNEPGVYLTGKFGVRIENLVLTVNCEAPGMDGFLGFETLTVAPYDRESIIPERLTDAELRTLNDYHESVYQKLSPYLTGDEAEWLRQETAPIER